MLRARLAPVLVSPACLMAAAGGQCLFEDVTGPAGLGDYQASAGDGHGPGAVFADLSGDGWPDLYVMAVAPSSNRLFVNVPDGSGGRRFEPLPGGAGADHPGAATGAIAGDYDNDGDLDLYVLNFDEPNVLLQNRLVETGALTFLDVTAGTDPTPGLDDGQFGVGLARYEGVPLDNSLTAAWADVDRDGDLDLYVGNHNGWSSNPIEGPFDLPGRRDVFYLNLGDGTFLDMTMPLGLGGFETADGAHETPYQRFSSTNAVIFADFDDDGWPDLLVTNKVGGPTDRDMLYRNLGAAPGEPWGGFELITYDLSPTFGHRSPAAMGVDVADWDGDGDLDVYVTDWTNPDDPDAPGRNDLWLNRLAETGALGFEHSGQALAVYSWGAQLQDFDLDGRVDLHVATQAGYADVLYVNLAGGVEEQGAAAGIDQIANARGDVSADYDLDGWPDLFVVNLGGAPSALYRNRSWEVAPPRSSLLVRLAGDPGGPGPWRSPRDAIGARIRLGADLDGDRSLEPGEIQVREVRSGSSNAASTSSLLVELGLDQASAGVLEVRWPGGRLSTFAVEAGGELFIDEAGLSDGDIDGDGRVDVADLVAVVSHWGPCPAPPFPCLDRSGNGAVDQAEIVIVLREWR